MVGVPFSLGEDKQIYCAEVPPQLFPTNRHHWSQKYQICPKQIPVIFFKCFRNLAFRIIRRNMQHSAAHAGEGLSLTDVRIYMLLSLATMLSTIKILYTLIYSSRQYSQKLFVKRCRMICYVLFQEDNMVLPAVHTVL